jgi:hypothetical protein
MNNTNNIRRPRKGRRSPELSIFQRLTPKERRQARKIAYESALAIIG